MISRLNIYILASICVAIFIVVFFFFRNKLKEATHSFGIISLVTLFSLGLWCHSNSLPENKTNYFALQKLKATDTIVLKITKRLKANAYYNKYYAEIISRNNEACSGNLLIQQKKDSTVIYPIDAILVTQGLITRIKPPPNPHQFNYSNYLKEQGVYHQLYIDNQLTKTLENNNRSFAGWSDNLITKINSELKKRQINAEELAIINALLLGQKQQITNELYDSYSNSGAIHILAVSGLHVGILLMILQLLLRPFFRFKHGNFIKASVIILLLWLYAILTGGSASVTRATTMFSLVALAINLNKKTSIINTLIASIFIILLFKPRFLFNVGFQLSYAAVFSIVAFQPLIVSLFKPKYVIINYFWKVLSVTLAAQFGIIPISLFYFHQFPGLFWLSNLVIIPLLPIILGLGVLVIVILLIGLDNVVAQCAIKLLESSIYLMNTFLKWVSSFESFLFKDIYFNELLVVFSLLLVISLYKVWKKTNYKRLVYFMVSILGLQIVFFISDIKSDSNEFVIFHKTKTTSIAIKNNKSLQFHNETLQPNYITKSYKVGSNVNQVKFDSIKSIYTINKKTILVIDSLGIYNLKSLQPDMVLLINSPKINLDRLLKTINPEKIIADGSNHKSYIKRWSATCRDKKSLFHATEKGAFIYRY